MPSVTWITAANSGHGFLIAFVILFIILPGVLRWNFRICRIEAHVCSQHGCGGECYLYKTYGCCWEFHPGIVEEKELGMHREQQSSN